jgi:hypothetical protein
MIGEALLLGCSLSRHWFSVVLHHGGINSAMMNLQATKRDFVVGVCLICFSKSHFSPVLVQLIIWV